MFIMFTKYASRLLSMTYNGGTLVCTHSLKLKKKLNHPF